MTIKVIERTTKEIEQETQDLFHEIKPLLDKGYSYSKAVREIKQLPYGYPCNNLAWYRNLIEYGEKQGYSYKEFMRTRKQ